LPPPHEDAIGGRPPLDPGESRTDHHIVMASFMLKPILHFNSYHEKKRARNLFGFQIRSLEIQSNCILFNIKIKKKFKIINSLIQSIDLTFTHDLIIKNLVGYTQANLKVKV
jgi:hypothetical protein